MTLLKKHLIQAAERGDAEAQFNLAVTYENGLVDSRYIAEGNHSEAVRWLLAAAEQGLARAQMKLAEMYADEPNMPDGSVKACEWVPVGGENLAWCASSEGAIRLSACRSRVDAGSDRRSHAPPSTSVVMERCFCSGLESSAGSIPTEADFSAQRPGRRRAS